jgi:hypothetical protein
MGPTALLPLRRKACWGFFASKIRRLRPSANPRTWIPKASMLTTRPPKLLYCTGYRILFLGHFYIWLQQIYYVLPQIYYVLPQIYYVLPQIYYVLPQIYCVTTDILCVTTDILCVTTDILCVTTALCKPFLTKYTWVFNFHSVTSISRAHLSVLTTKHKIYPSFNQSVHTSYTVIPRLTSDPANKFFG